MLKIDEVTHFMKHFDLPDLFFPSKIVPIYHFWYLLFNLVKSLKLRLFISLPFLCYHCLF